MRKQLVPPSSETIRPHDEGWLDLERAAAVEVTSEEEDFPVERALVSGEARGWRAAMPGTQTIRLVFDQQQKLRRISLVFEEHETPRTQEFVLRWSSDGGFRFEKLSVSSGILTRLKPSGRSKHTRLNLPTSSYLS